MQLQNTVIFVDSVVKTIEYYEKVFGLKRRFITLNNQYGEMETGPTALAFATHEYNPFGKGNGIDRVVIRLSSNDVIADFKSAIDKGANILEEPNKNQWGRMSCCVTDLNEFAVEIVSKMPFSAP